jgi:hypothetical protein
MPATVAANARSVVHAGSKGLSIAFPDVCKTPAALGAPLPYPNLARSSDAAKTAKRTTADGQNICLASSEFTPSMGDEAGAGGGVVSQTFRGKAGFVAGSQDVIVEGKGVARAFDLMLHNARNTPPFPVLQPPLITLAARTWPTCLLCGILYDPASPGRHVPAAAPEDLHQQKAGKACLWAHRPGFENHACCHRHQAVRAVHDGIGARYGVLPPDAFHDRSRPFWHDAHHLIAPRLVHAAIDTAAGDDAGKAAFCRLALLQADYQINDGRNLVILPSLAAEARRFALPRRLVIDAATLGIPPALAGAFAGVNAYDLILDHLLTPIMQTLAAGYRPRACHEDGPAPGAVAKLALEKLADLIRSVITAPNHALDWVRS